MTKFKRALATLAASAMMFTMSGCTDTRYAMTYDNGTKVNAGVYIYNLYTELSYQLTMSYYTTGSMELDLNSDMEGQKLRDYLVEQARKATKELAAVTYQFDKLGLTLTDEELETISDNVSGIWDSSGDLMEAEGISKESIRQVFRAQTMRTRLFDYYYGEGGTEAVTDADLQKYVEDNYIRYKAIRISKSTAEDETEAANENAEKEATRNEFLAKAQGLDYDKFDSVIDEYDTYAQALLEAETSAEEDTIGPAPLDDTETAVEAPVEDEEDLADASDLTTKNEDSIAEEESNPNESMLNYGGMDDEAKESTNGKLGEFLNGMEINKATAYDDENFYYILIKGDITENSASYAATNHDNLIQSMKGDDFQAKIDSWIDEIGISENSDAIKRYTAQAVYDKQIEFYGK